jgi:hypothetical protein
MHFHLGFEEANISDSLWMDVQDRRAPTYFQSERGGEGGVPDRKAIYNIFSISKTYEVWQKSNATGNAVHEPTRLPPPPSHGS